MVAVAVGVAVGALVAVLVGEGVPVAVLVTVGVLVAVAASVGDGVRVAVGWFVSVAVGMGTALDWLGADLPHATVSSNAMATLIHWRVLTLSLSIFANELTPSRQDTSDQIACPFECIEGAKVSAKEVMHSARAPIK